MKLNFVPLDLVNNLNTITRFKRDSFLASFGTDELLIGADGAGIDRYVNLISERNNFEGSCVHVMFGNEIVGQIELRRIADDPQRGYVNLFYLVPELRARGLGRQLESYATTFFLNEQMTSAELNVSPTNLLAINFYLKMRWKIQNRIYKSGADVFVMTKELG